MVLTYYYGKPRCFSRGMTKWYSLYFVELTVNITIRWYAITTFWNTE